MMVKGAIFQNRAAIKMANMDAVFDFMFQRQERNSRSIELLYFADICAGPGGFSEYMLWRKTWHCKGFGFSLKGENDFKLEKFLSGTPQLTINHSFQLTITTPFNSQSPLLSTHNHHSFRRLQIGGGPSTRIRTIISKLPSILWTTLTTPFAALWPRPSSGIKMHTPQLKHRSYVAANKFTWTLFLQKRD